MDECTRSPRARCIPRRSGDSDRSVKWFENTKRSRPKMETVCGMRVHIYKSARARTHVENTVQVLACTRVVRTVYNIMSRRRRRRRRLRKRTLARRGRVAYVRLSCRRRLCTNDRKNDTFRISKKNRAEGFFVENLIPRGYTLTLAVVGTELVERGFVVGLTSKTRVSNEPSRCTLYTYTRYTGLK